MTVVAFTVFNDEWGEMVGKQELTQLRPSVPEITTSLG